MKDSATKRLLDPETSARTKVPCLSGSVSHMSVPAEAAEEVKERLTALQDLDKRITDILDKGSKIVESIVDGKKQEKSMADAKESFLSAMAEYRELVQSINKDLRSEVKLLHNAWSRSVLPLSLQAKATSFGQTKENEVWRDIGSQVNPDAMDES